MVLNKLFWKVYRKITFKGILNYDVIPNVDAWRKYIGELSYPSDDIERAFNRYKCRMYYFPIYYKVLANTASFFALLFSLNIIRKKVLSKKGALWGVTLVLAPDVDFTDVVPDEITNEYGTIITVNQPKRYKWFLNSHAKSLLKETLKKYPLQFYFNYWVFRELCMYSYYINEYNSKAIAVYVQERNIAAPLICNMCEHYNIDFISFMHGDYIFQLIHGFMKFTKFYVWDDHYVKMFKEDLKCIANEFIVYTPKKHCGICKPRENDTYEYFASYYFSGESKDGIYGVAFAFNYFESLGKKCKVRPHPRSTQNHDLINEVFANIVIENPLEVSLAESVECSKFIIALNSTVLSQAYYSNKEIVIDDYSDYNSYKILNERNYIMLTKKHILLSDLLLNYSKLGVSLDDK